MKVSFQSAAQVTRNRTTSSDTHASGSCNGRPPYQSTETNNKTAYRHYTRLYTARTKNPVVICTDMRSSQSSVPTVSRYGSHY